ncbi:MAG: AAA family ATPase [Vibrionaceae bacterium]|nr:AAA family ATPase [Vibrionaceae bacterium]
MKFRLTLNNVQHIKKLEFEIDSEAGKILCLVGKNSAGKTTLLRSIRNIYLSNTFIETAAPYIFSDDSSIEYSFDEDLYTYSYNSKLRTLDSKQVIPDEIKDQFLVELPMPHGERFSQFRRLVELDEQIRSKIAIGDYQDATDLIYFLSKIYEDDRFEQLKEITIKKTKYYFILRDEKDRFYIREDYLSSGEYFVINLFRHIESGKKIIYIDEIDISLDSIAQVNLLKTLRDICTRKNIFIVFSTHSLALMKTVKPSELFYIERDEDTHEVSIEKRSYNFIKSLLYRFTGYDKYLLTEDECLENYLHYILSKSENTFFKYHVIYIGGGSQVVDLIVRNSKHQFLSSDDDVLAVLDGDQRDEKYHKGCNNILFLPFSNIEMEVLNRYEGGCNLLPQDIQIDGKKDSKRAKNLIWKLTKIHGGRQIMTMEDIYLYLEKFYEQELKDLEKRIISFLSL